MNTLTRSARANIKIDSTVVVSVFILSSHRSVYRGLGVHSNQETQQTQRSTLTVHLGLKPLNSPYQLHKVLFHVLTATTFQVL